MKRKRNKVFQHTETDCFKAAIATLLNIPYEDGPDLGEAKCWDVTIRWWGHWSKTRRAIIMRSNIDDWIKFKRLKLTLFPIRKFVWPWEYSLGLTIPHNWPTSAIGLPEEPHVVVLKGKKIWHDPSGLETPQCTQVIFRVRVENE